MSYEKLDIADFGRQLVTTGDLDPVYVALAGVSRGEPSFEDKDQLRRWLLAYWCSYHCGFSSWVSEQEDYHYWDAMGEWALNTTEAPVGGRWPRGRERRHFRGQKAFDAVKWFIEHYKKPEAPVQSIEKLATNHPSFTLRYEVVREIVMTWPLFGPWIAFKVGDMLERVMGVPINFNGSDVFFFEQPKQAAKIWLERSSDQFIFNVETPAVAHLEFHLRDLKAPPTYDRPLNFQEFETILCKWKSHLNGYYPVGIDSKELRHSLEPWAKISETAANMREAVWYVG